MAALRAMAAGDNVATGTAAKTIMQIAAAANQRVKILEIGIFFRGVVNTDEPIIVNFFRQSSAGTMSSLTPYPIDEGVSETIQTTCTGNASAEPTSTNALAAFAVHPQTGMVYQVPKGDEIIVKGGGRFGVVVTAAVSVMCDFYVKFEE